jgi:hypothetical protein
MRSRTALRFAGQDLSLAKDRAERRASMVLIDLDSRTEWSFGAIDRLSPRSETRPRPSLGWSSLPKLV